MASELKWYELAEFDDFLTASVIDNVYYWATIRKAYSQSNLQPEEVLSSKECLKLIRNHLIFPTGAQAFLPSPKKMNYLIQDFMTIPKVRRFLQRYPYESKVLEFTRHARRYYQLYQPDCGFDICTTDRYMSRSNKLEACVVAKKEFQENELIVYLNGGLVPINEEEVNLNQNDFSIINIGSKRQPNLMLGPTRFLNHDCNGNAKFRKSGHRGEMTIVATRRILIGEEICVCYASDYFGKKNRDCLCATCEREGRGAFEPRSAVTDDVAPTVDSSSDDDVNEVIIVKDYSDCDDEKSPTCQDCYPTPNSNFPEDESVFEILSSGSSEDSEIERRKLSSLPMTSLKNEITVIESSDTDINSIDASDLEWELDFVEKREAKLYARPVPETPELISESGSSEAGESVKTASPKVKQELELSVIPGEVENMTSVSDSTKKLVPNSTENLSSDASSKLTLAVQKASSSQEKPALSQQHHHPPEVPPASAITKKPPEDQQAQRSRPRRVVHLVNRPTIEAFPIDRSYDTLKEKIKKIHRPLNTIEISQRRVFKTFQRLYNKLFYDPEYQQRNTIYDCFNCGCYFLFDEEAFNKLEYGIATSHQNRSATNIANLYCPRCLRHFKIFKMAWPLTKYEPSMDQSAQCARQFLDFRPVQHGPVALIKGPNLYRKYNPDTKVLEISQEELSKPENMAYLSHIEFENRRKVLIKEYQGRKSELERLGDLKILFLDLGEMKLHQRPSSSSKDAPLRFQCSKIFDPYRNEWSHLFQAYFKKIEGSKSGNCENGDKKCSETPEPKSRSSSKLCNKKSSSAGSSKSSSLKINRPRAGGKSRSRRSHLEMNSSDSDEAMAILNGNSSGDQSNHSIAPKKLIKLYKLIDESSDQALFYDSKRKSFSPVASSDGSDDGVKSNDEDLPLTSLKKRRLAEAQS